MTNSSNWQSSLTSVASVSASGLATSYLKGETVITGTYQGQSDTATLVVTDAILNGLVISPPNLVKPVGTEGQYTATAYYSNGDTKNVTSRSVWQSSDTAVVSIETGSANAGLADALAIGEVDISARFGGQTASTKATVTDAELLELVLSPLNESIPSGTTLPYSLTGIYTDGIDRDLTTQAAWQTDNNSIASIDSLGVATGNNEGQVNVTASVDTKSISTTLTVTAATITKIVVSPNSINLPVGHTDQFTARAFYSDLSEQDVTQLATWTSDKTSIVHIQSGAQGGLIEGVSVGTTTVEARFDGFSDTGQVIVGEAVLESVVISPKTASVAAGNTQQFELQANFSDGNQIPVTTSANWQTDDASIALISSNDGLAEPY